MSVQQLVDHLIRTYDPLSVIVYGSYANGTQDRSSDFDALVISHRAEMFHDTSFVDGVQMDVFVYPAACFAENYDCNDFVQIFDGKIVLDRDGLGQAVQQRVLTYLKENRRKSAEDIRSGVDWCLKMLARCRRGDAEGLYRWHWLLMDSLEIFCDVMHTPYFGPKKALRWMQANSPDAYACYTRALSDFTLEPLEAWIDLIAKCAAEAQEETV